MKWKKVFPSTNFRILLKDKPEQKLLLFGIFGGYFLLINYFALEWDRKSGIKRSILTYK